MYHPQSKRIPECFTYSGSGVQDEQYEYLHHEISPILTKHHHWALSASELTENPLFFNFKINKSANSFHIWIQQLKTIKLSTYNIRIRQF